MGGAGSGDADRVTVDEHDRLRVPPDKPEYTLRRVWLTKEEEHGYYYGFANEGLWPLCHIAHTRPIFRASDWQSYQTPTAICRRRADEMAGRRMPLVLVQDYHFALLPRMIKEARPDARVAIFWHIPWPNPEAFGICPWQRELLDGLLGADLVGFHIHSHCNNFLETVDAALESRIEWERFAVNRAGTRTFVRPFPISVDFREVHRGPGEAQAAERAARRVAERIWASRRPFWAWAWIASITPRAIPERFAAWNVFWKSIRCIAAVYVRADRSTEPHATLRAITILCRRWRRKPRGSTRASRPRLEADRVAHRHHSHEEILPYYRAADLCMVTSLHDGMNLVAKEFVAARDDEEGALILSQFTGASRACATRSSSIRTTRSSWRRRCDWPWRWMPENGERA